MHILIILFVISLACTLILTPLAARVGRKIRAVDEPGLRKVHTCPCPRSGGIAFYINFLLLVILASYLPSLQPWFSNSNLLFLLAGLSIAFGMGLVDDIFQLNCLIKLGFQVLSATLAFAGGLQIDHFYLHSLHLEFGLITSYLLTVFWFLLFLNAINLIDGLDGLATGIILFASSIMTIFLAWKGDLQSAALFVIIAGSCLGFLRYNFNPAKIFLGDSGSYFLGYTIAAFSILGEYKSPVSASILIPVIGMGLPIIDTLLSPIRRFLHGKKIFQPDSEHIHHRLLSRGLSTKQAIWSIYALTIALCIASLYLVHLRDMRGVLLLILMGATVSLFIYKLGYFDQLKKEGFSTWIKDVSYEIGLNQDRRSFVTLQENISKSKDYMTLWQNIIVALTHFEFDLGELILFRDNQDANNNPENERFIWTTNSHSYTYFMDLPGTMKIELPLITKKNDLKGILWVIKDMRNAQMSHYTLRRIEHLRRSVLKAVESITHNESCKKIMKEN